MKGVEGRQQEEEERRKEADNVLGLFFLEVTKS